MNTTTTETIPQRAQTITAAAQYCTQAAIPNQDVYAAWKTLLCSVLPCVILLTLFSLSIAYYIQSRLEWPTETYLTTSDTTESEMQHVNKTNAYTLHETVLCSISRTVNSYGKWNSTHIIIHQNFKTITISNDPSALIRYPVVSVQHLNFISSTIPPNSQTPLVKKEPVTIRHDGGIVIDTIIPLDSRSTVMMLFNNGEWSTSIDPLDIITNQLKSCSYLVHKSDIHCLCHFSYFSGLCGCRVEAISMDTYRFIDITSSQGHDVIADVPNGQYLMKCHGLKDCQSDGVSDSVSDSVITYDDQLSYHSYIKHIQVLSGDEYTSSTATMPTKQTLVMMLLMGVVVLPYIFIVGVGGYVFNFMTSNGHSNVLKCHPRLVINTIFKNPLQ